MQHEEYYDLFGIFNFRDNVLLNLASEKITHLSS